MTKSTSLRCDACSNAVPAHPVPKGWIEVVALGSTPVTRTAHLCSDECLVAYIAASEGHAFERIGRPL